MSSTHTSVQSGNWSSAGTWNNGVPHDGDTVTISSGHTVVFDVDMSSFTQGIILTINGTLECTRTPGNYYLKSKGVITINTGGLLRAGEVGNPLPTNVNFTIDLTSSSNYISGGGRLDLIGTDPNIRYVRLTQTASSGATTLYVDRDVTGDSQWSAGKKIYIINSTSRSVESRIISAIYSNRIEITSWLSSSKSVDSVVYLVPRNVRLTATSLQSSPLGRTKTSNLALECDLMGILSSSVYLLASGNDTNFYGGVYSVGSSGRISNGDNCYFAQNALFILGSYSFISMRYLITSGCVFANDGNEALTRVPNIDVDNCIFLSNSAACAYSVGVIKNTEFLYNYGIRAASYMQLDNCLFKYCTEFDGCNYVESYNHNRVPGAVKVVSRGGVTVSCDDPTGNGESGWMRMMPASSTYPTWYERRFTVDPGEYVKVSLRAKVVGSISPLPKFQLVDITDDPMKGPLSAPICEVEVPGTDPGYTHVLTWENKSMRPVDICARIVVTATSGDVYFKMSRKKRFVYVSE